MRFLDDYRDVLINPTVIIEVFSGSTKKFDRAQKFLRYQKYLPTLVDYVLVSQEQPAVELYHRHLADVAVYGGHRPRGHAAGLFD